MLEVQARKQLGALTIDADFSCPAQGIVALFGRSGAGKTSIVNMIAGLLRPESGRIAIAGSPLFDAHRRIDLPPEHRRLGYVFQESRLFPHHNVRGNLLYGYRRAPRAERAIEPGQIIELLGLEALLTRRPHDLSGGERQRVALGRALLANPRLLLMDEPLANLDQRRREEVLPFIERLRDELAIPIVYVSHAMPEIVRLADTLVLVDEGRVAAVGGVEELTSRLDLRPLTGRYEAGAVVAARIAARDRVYGLAELSFAGGRLRMPDPGLPLGSEVRVRIRARDVALSREAPHEISILNVLPARIVEFAEPDGAQLDVRLDLAGTALWARITLRSRQDLRLEPGSEVFALIKAAAIDRPSLGFTPRRESAPAPS